MHLKKELVISIHGERISNKNQNNMASVLKHWAYDVLSGRRKTPLFFNAPSENYILAILTNHDNIKM